MKLFGITLWGDGEVPKPRKMTQHEAHIKDFREKHLPSIIEFLENGGEWGEAFEFPRAYGFKYYSYFCHDIDDFKEMQQARRRGLEKLQRRRDPVKAHFRDELDRVRALRADEITPARKEANT
jgi:hypothetical protein